MPDLPDRDIDLQALRAGRLARLQEAMRAHDLDACLLFHEPNIRYATGASAMPVWSTSTFVRCALVPAEGSPILFEHANSIHRSRLVTPDVRPMHVWEFFEDPEPEVAVWAAETLGALRELGITGDRLAVDRLGTPGFLALQAAGLTLVDAAPATMQARSVKTREEVALFRANGALVVDMLGAFEAAIDPTVRERDLLGVLSQAMLRGGGEYLATNSVCSGSNTNPWRSEATDRAVEPGDLVWVDTDTVGIEGYFFCVSRTFAVGEASQAQRAVYRDALTWLEAMKEVVRPGLSMAEIAERAPKLADKYLPQRYECMIHGAGLEEESPSVCYPIDRQSNPERVLEEGMTLVIELYAGEVGARDGVKLGDEVLVTADGVEVLAPYPFSDVLS